MKKRWMVAALLIFAILLSGCGGTAKISPEKSPLDFKSSTLLGSGEETFVCTGLRDGEGAELEAVAIPETYQGLPVTAIGEGAFRGNQNLKKIVIPETITAIDVDAFRNSAIEELVIPASVRWKTGGHGLDFSPFDSVQECKQLRTLVIQAPITKFDGLQDCPNITAIQLPETVETVNGLTSRSVPLLTDIYFCGTAEQWMNRYCLALENLTVHCSDATMRYEGMFFQEFLEFDGAWWLESTILPDYAEGVEMPVQEEPAREEESVQGSGEMVLARIKTYMYPQQQYLESVQEFTFDENGRVARELTMERNEYTEALYEYDEEGRAIHSIETKKKYDGTVLSLEDEYTMEYNDAGQLIYYTRDSNMYGTYAMHVRYNENGWLDSAWREYPDGYTVWEFGYEYRFHDDGSFRGVVSRDEDGFMWTESYSPNFPDIRFMCPAVFRENRQDWEKLMLYRYDYWDLRFSSEPGPTVEECDEEGKILRYVDDNWGREYEYDRNGRVASWFHHVATTYERYGFAEYAPLDTVTKTGAELYAPPERPSELDW